MKDSTTDGSTGKVLVWDLPVRLFHWALVAAVGAALLAQWMGEMTWHMYAGYTALTLVLFRLVWGLVGSDTARFAHFLRGPAALRRYLATGERDRAGHNPLGAISVVALLALVLTQVGTGLFANDDIFFEGPWAGTITKRLSDSLTGLHGLNKTLLLILIGLHVLAIAWYRWRGEDLVRPMITGRADPPPGADRPRHRPLWLAAAVLALSAAVSGVVFRFWLL